MYSEHFGLRCAPFAITPDTSFNFASAAQCDAWNALLLAIDAGEGFIKVVGEVGTGKTLLCRRLLACLASAQHAQRRFRTAYLPNPCVGPQALLRGIAAELKIRSPASQGETSLLDALHRALIRAAGRGEQIVVCLDEAQALPRETLEALRLLSNLETESRKLLQIVLFGQPELDERLARWDMRQLRSRIAFEMRLRPLDAEETPAYLDHRLRVAGRDGSSLFSARAARRLHLASSGLPRNLHILAHKSLLAAFGQGSPRVELRHVQAACRDTSGASRSGFGSRWIQALRTLIARASLPPISSSEVQV